MEKIIFTTACLFSFSLIAQTAVHGPISYKKTFSDTHEYVMSISKKWPYSQESISVLKDKIKRDALKFCEANSGGFIKYHTMVEQYVLNHPETSLTSSQTVSFVYEKPFYNTVYSKEPACVENDDQVICSVAKVDCEVEIKSDKPTSFILTKSEEFEGKGARKKCNELLEILKDDPSVLLIHKFVYALNDCSVDFVKLGER